MTDVELVPVETVKPGDSITVGAADVVVAEVNEYDDTFVVVYFKQGVETYENKARDSSGRNQRNILALQSIAPMMRGETLIVERGNPANAARLRREMEEGEAARATAAAQRWQRAGIADDERRAGNVVHADPPRPAGVEPRSYMCLCQDKLSEHALVRDQSAPGGVYHYGRCLVEGCTCPAAENETGTIKERR